MNDLFEETEENLRKEKWIGIAKKSLPWLGGLLGILLIASVSAILFQNLETQAINKQAKSYQLAIEYMQKPDLKLSQAEFSKIAKSNSGNYAALAHVHLASFYSKDGKTAESVAELKQAVKKAKNKDIKYLATLKIVYMEFDKAKYEETETLLKPILADKHDLQFLAQEALAMAKIKSGDVSGGIAQLNVLSKTLGVPEGLKQSAMEKISILENGSIAEYQKVISLPDIAIPTNNAANSNQLLPQ